MVTVSNWKGFSISCRSRRVLRRRKKGQKGKPLYSTKRRSLKYTSTPGLSSKNLRRFFCLI